MTPDNRSEWQKRIGVGERQPRDLIVSDGTRTHATVVRSDIDGHKAGTQTEHRSGRVDGKVTRAVVTPNPYWQPRRSHGEE